MYNKTTKDCKRVFRFVKLLSYIKKVFNKFYILLGIRKSVADDGSYPKFCELASENDEVFQTFRRHPSYTKILEHVSDDLGIKYYKNIKNEFGLTDKEIFSYCEKIHDVGSPYLVNLITDLPPISTTALRYLSTGLQINSILESKNIEKIIEIGAGYGGQAVILDSLLNIKEYTFVDLREVNLLIKKFLSKSDVGFIPQFNSLEDSFNKQYDLVISNFAFSELSRTLQNIAMNKIIKKSNKGFMIINSHNFNEAYNFYTKEELLSELPNSIFLPEVPNSSLKGENYLLTF
mgnify:FL=1